MYDFTRWFVRDQLRVAIVFVDICCHWWPKLADQSLMYDQLFLWMVIFYVRWPESTGTLFEWDLWLAFVVADLSLQVGCSPVVRVWNSQSWYTCINNEEDTTYIDIYI